MKRLFYTKLKPRPSTAHAQLLPRGYLQAHIMALNQQQVNQQQNVIPGNDDAANLARQIQANTKVTMKMEVMKLPDFYGDPSKDTITVYGPGIHGPH
jgi:hypothetical protein